MEIRGKAKLEAHAALVKKAMADVERRMLKCQELERKKGAGAERKRAKAALLKAQIVLGALVAVNRCAAGTGRRDTQSDWRERVLKTLEDFGAMSVRELARELNPPKGNFASTRKSVINALRQLKDDEVHGGKVYIKEFVREQLPGMTKAYPVAKFALGNLPDAEPIPKLTGSEMCKNYRDKRKRFVPSVFAFQAPFSKLRDKRVPAGFNAA